MDRGPKMQLAVLLSVLAVVVAQELPVPVFRLPDTVLPRSYVLRLEPDLDQNVLNGIVMIDLLTTSNTSESINSITLNLGADPSIVEDTATLVSVKGTIVQDLSFNYDSDAETVQINLPDGVNLDNNEVYVLTLKFQSQIYNSPIGVFTGFFNSSSKYLASSFRATFARNAFPCFDEPQIQAPITLQVLRPSDYKVVSTAKLANSDKVDATYVLDTFAPTPAISASALGLFMSQLDPVSAMGINVYATGNTTSPWLGDVITKLNLLLGAFPSVQTLNLVVLPDQPAKSFSSFGFIYTTPEVFYDEIKAFLRANVLKTELTEALLQQWLAYSRTPAWWSDLWLTESIGAYLAKTLIPEVPVLDLDAISVRSISFDYPVISPLLAPLDIETAIAQKTIRNKGLGVLSMWRDTLPETVLENTIIEYVALKKPLTTTEDFLDLLDKNIKANTTYDVTPAIDELASWLTAEDIPAVTVSSNNIGFTLSQSVGCPSFSNDTSLRPISISFAQEATQQWSNIRQGLWLLGNNLTVTAPQDTWTIFNLESAPYRTNYGDWSAILAALNNASTPVPVALRATLLDDAISLAAEGCVSWTDALKLLNSTQLAQADWLIVTKVLDNVADLFGNDQYAQEAWQLYAETVFSPALLPLVDLYNTSVHVDQWYARSLVTPWLCKLGLGTCRDAVKALFQPTSGVNADVDPNDVDNVVCLGARFNPTIVDRLISDYQSAPSFEMRRLFVIALGCLTDQTSVQTVLNNITKLSAQDARDVLVGLASSVENFNAVQDLIVAQCVDLEKNLLGSGFLADVVKTFGQLRIPVEKLTGLLEDETLDLSWYVKKSIVQTSLSTKFNMDWFAAHGQSLEQILPQPSTEKPPTVPPHTQSSAPPAPVTTSKPSAASSLMDLRVLTLVLSAAVLLILRGL